MLHGVNGGRGVQRLLVGNPLTAVDLLSRDLKIGLSAPYDLLVLENEDGSSSVVYQDPMAMFTGCSGDEELISAATKMSSGLEKLVVGALEE